MGNQLQSQPQPQLSIPHSSTPPLPHTPTPQHPTPHYPLSYWEQESFFKNIDVAVIGAGIVGLSAALHLKEVANHLRVVVLERGPLPVGASTRNAGFACFGSLTELIADLKSHDEEEVFDLIRKRLAGLDRLRNRLGDKTIRYQEQGGYELFRPEDEGLYQVCLEKMGYFNEKLAQLTGFRQTFEVADQKIRDFGFNGVKHLIINRKEGAIHTGEMMRALLARVRQKGVDIITGLEIKALESAADGISLQTGNGWTIRAGKVLVATNGFARNLLPALAVKPARNQVLITEPIPGLALEGCFHYDHGYYYFRNIDDRILLGGGRNLNPEGEETDQFGHTEPIQNALIRLLKTVILPAQEVKIDTWWSGILGVGEQKKPIVEKINEHLVVAVRMGGMGVAIGSLIGEEGAELLLK